MEVAELKAMVKARIDSINAKNKAEEAARRLEKESRY